MRLYFLRIFFQLPQLIFLFANNSLSSPLIPTPNPTRPDPCTRAAAHHRRPRLTGVPRRRDMTTNIVNIADPSNVQVLRHPAAVRSVAFDPLEQYLVRTHARALVLLCPPSLSCSPGVAGRARTGHRLRRRKRADLAVRRKAHVRKDVQPLPACVPHVRDPAQSWTNGGWGSPFAATDRVKRSATSCAARLPSIPTARSSPSPARPVSVSPSRRDPGA